MLANLFQDTLSLGIAQAVAAALLAILAMWVARTQRIHLERETLVALVRGIVQIVAVGSILVFVFKGPTWTGAIVLAIMMAVAALISARRSRELPGAYRVAFISIVLGAGAVIATMTSLGVIAPTLTSLIPIGSMIIASTMNASALALERFKAELLAHVGQIEAGLALGAAPSATVGPYLQAAVTASLIPQINSLRSLGIVWIPGLMAGMVLSGTDPLYAAVYQFVVIAMIFGASSVTSVTAALLVRPRVFTPADQLILRPRG
ncbi:MAG TPA: ABC transporter permease [Gemmatimonadales bacterium]|nr:ABC transporter permease [Gemmatimonadales bacterium]